MGNKEKKCKLYNRYTDNNVEQRELVVEFFEYYVGYAIAVAQGRAISSMTDGLIPAERRSLISMIDIGATDKAKKKSARLVGHTLGVYHPHGDSSCYMVIVKFTQDWNMNYTLASKQGNFGSEGNPAPASMRYTECGMSEFCESLIKDYFTDRSIVPDKPTYDANGREPTCLPVRLPLILLNGTMGIGVGISTSIPPHKLSEVVDALIYIVENRDSTITLDDIMQFIKGPNFPRATIASSRQQIRDAYENGGGKFNIRTPCTHDKKTNSIIFDSIPYRGSKSHLISQLLVCKEKGIIPISSIRDESTKNVRIVIKINQGSDMNVVENKIYQHTGFSTTFSFIPFALDLDGKLRKFNLLSFLKRFIDFRENTIVIKYRNLIYKKKKLLARALAYLILLSNTETILAIIKKTTSKEDSRDQLKKLKCNIPKNFNASDLDIVGDVCYLSPIQIDFLLGLSISKLSGFAEEKLLKDVSEIKSDIEKYLSIINDRKQLDKLMIDEWRELKVFDKKERTTVILDDEIVKNTIDLIEYKELVVVLSSNNYIKKIPLSCYKKQHSGGKGVSSDSNGYFFKTNSREKLMLFSNMGIVRSIFVYMINLGDRTSSGKALINLIPNIQPGEKIIKAMNCGGLFLENKFLLFIYRNGRVRKNISTSFKKIYANGKKYNKESTPIIDILEAKNDDDLIITTCYGKVIRISVKSLNPIVSTTAKGVIGIRLSRGDQVMGATVINNNNGYLLFISENGLGKKTPADKFTNQHHGGKGVIGFKCNKKTGHLSSVKFIDKDNTGDIILASSDGRTIRFSAENIPTLNKDTSGNKMITNLHNGNKIVNAILCES